MLPGVGLVKPVPKLSRVGQGSGITLHRVPDACPVVGVHGGEVAGIENPVLVAAVVAEVPLIGRLVSDRRGVREGNTECQGWGAVVPPNGRP